MRGEPVNPNPRPAEPLSGGPQPAADAASHTPAPISGGHAVPAPRRPRHAAPSTAPSPASTAAVGEAAGLPQAQVRIGDAQEIKQRVGERLQAALRTSPAMTRADREQRCQGWINEEVALWYQRVAAEVGTPPTGAEEMAMAQQVFDLLFRAGRLQPYLDDPRVQNILINGHDQVWLDYGFGRREQVPPIAASDAELVELLREMARNPEEGQAEKNFGWADPFLALRLKDGSRLQAITGVSPKTYAVIRRHGQQHADLERLVELGSIDSTLAEFLTACVRAKKNVMIAGPQGAGKTTLMGAMLRCFGADERFATVQTEDELRVHLNGFHRQVVPLEARESNGEIGADGKRAGEITLLDLIQPSLRMMLSRIVVGEVRGPEVVAMMQALTSGSGGNLCTIHSMSPQLVFDRVAELYLLARANATESIAYTQIRNGIHFVVYVDMIDETPIGGKRHQFVSHVLEVTGRGESGDGRPATNEIFAPSRELGEPRAVPRMHPACLPDLMRAGFPAHLLDAEQGTWKEPLPLKVNAW